VVGFALSQGGVKVIQDGSTVGRLKYAPGLSLSDLFLPRDPSPLKSIGSWEGWKVDSGPHPGEGPGCTDVRFV
jgi:hypothetical protein